MTYRGPTRMGGGFWWKLGEGIGLGSEIAYHWELPSGCMLLCGFIIT